MKKFNMAEDESKDANDIIENRIKYMENISKQKRMNSIRESKANRELNENHEE